MRKKWIAVALLGAVVLSLCAGLSGCVDNAEQYFHSVEDLDGKRIAVLTGSVYDQAVKDVLPNCRIENANAIPDEAEMLNSGKVEAYVVDEPIARLLLQEYPDQMILAPLHAADYAFMFPKDDPERETLCKELNAFLAKSRSNGTLQEIDDIWFGDDVDAQVVDLDSLSAENGTLNMGITTSIGAPFAYVKDGKYVGYDIDVAARFCREYGYGLNIVDSTWTGMLNNISSGKCDFGASCIVVTAERKESALFSDPDYTGGIVLVVKRDPAAFTPITSLEELNGKKVGVITGAIFDQLVEQNIPGAIVQYVNVETDLAMMLDTGRLDAYVMDEPVVRLLLPKYPHQKVLTSLEGSHYGCMLTKDSERSEKICGELNNYVRKIKSDGTLLEIDNIWFGDNDEKKVVNFEDLPATNGVIRLGTDGVTAPFSYKINNKIVGFEIDLIARFCREYGYALKVETTDMAGIMPGVMTGKYDIGASCFAITEERKESVLFSDPYYDGGSVLIVNGSAPGAEAEHTSFFASIAESFSRTFIRENRWKLFTGGIGITMLISATAVLIGTIGGFLLYLSFRKGQKLPKILVSIFTTIAGNTPTVVTLMVLYYVIFGKTNLSGITISVIGFSLLFAGNVVDLVNVGVSAIDRGQTEAALALGYTEWHTFCHIVLPQAAKYILPGYQNAIVTLVKDTAVVGYIAVQDLTKVSDLVRSRTYEAFFPLIATALIYFFIARMLTLLIGLIQFKIDPERRSAERILKGVERK